MTGWQGVGGMTFGKTRPWEGMKHRTGIGEIRTTGSYAQYNIRHIIRFTHIYSYRLLLLNYCSSGGNWMMYAD
jgi:hypothetical protein